MQRASLLCSSGSILPREASFERTCHATIVYFFFVGFMRHGNVVRESQSRSGICFSVSGRCRVSGLGCAIGRTNNSTAQVVRIVLVGKEHACDCTRKKVDTALAALQQVLGNPYKIPVEMLKVDIEEDKVEPYRKQKPMMAVPAIYFVDAKGSVIDMLQGEITAEQIARIVKT